MESLPPITIVLDTETNQFVQGEEVFDLPVVGQAAEVTGVVPTQTCIIFCFAGFLVCLVLTRDLVECTGILFGCLSLCGFGQ
ncbi:MAG: hypothetical protein D6791_02345 [Chloroflexi bacterium]|nr:MAG: hypothetical protein D6791_02345 [Chloroflexota bacterium]